MSEDQPRLSTNKGFFSEWWEKIGKSAGFLKDISDVDQLQEEVLDVGTAHGGFWRFKRPEITNKYNIKGINDYFQVYLNSDLVRAPIDDLIESAFGNGYYTTVDLPPDTRFTDLAANSKAVRAKNKVDEFGEWHSLDELDVNLGKLKMIAGFVGVETIIAKGGPERSALKIIDPRTVRQNQGIETDPVTGRVIAVHQKVGSNENTILHRGFNEDKTLYQGIAWYNYGKLSTDPRGTSFIQGAVDLLNTISSVQSDIDKIFERYIGPLGIWTSTAPIDNIKQAVADRPQGEDIFIGKVKPEEIENLFRFQQIDPRVPYWDYQTYLDRRLYSYGRSNNLWYSKDATVASAETLDKIVQRHVTAIQRGQKRTVEREWFAPLMVVNNINIKKTPRMNFGAEPTGVEEIRVEDILVAGINLGFVSEPQYWDILRQLGVTSAAKVVEIDTDEEPAETPQEPDQPEEPEEDDGKTT